MSLKDDAIKEMLTAENNILALLARNGPIHEAAPDLPESFYRDLEEEMRPKFAAYRYAVESWVRATIAKEQAVTAENAKHIAEVYRS